MTTATVSAADPLPRYVTVAEFCERFRLSKTFVYDLIQSGRIRSIRIGASRRIPVSAVQAFADSLADSESAV